MFLGRLMRSAMVLISLKALSMARSELLMVRLFWYLELPNSSKLAAPVPCSGRPVDMRVKKTTTVCCFRGDQEMKVSGSFFSKLKQSMLPGHKCPLAFDATLTVFTHTHTKTKH